MQAYKNLVQNILDDGRSTEDRTGTGRLRISGASIRHNLDNGFPLLTLKKVNPATVFTELEFFIKGYNHKSWLQQKKCKIWDEWCDPRIVAYGTDDETKRNMLAEDRLGAIYGCQYRHWGSEYTTSGGEITDSGVNPVIFNYSDPNNLGIDQLAIAIHELKKNPFSTRMLISAWNVADLNKQALPPCHFAFQLLSDGEHLDLVFYMRSVDVFLGLPFNIASYSMLCHLIASTVGLKPGVVSGQFGDAHIYLNHMEQVKTLMARDCRQLPKLILPPNVDVFTWQGEQFELEGYQPHPFIKAPVAV